MSINLILSYPRSGSTFVRYIIEHFTQRPTRGPPTSTHLIDAPVTSIDTNKKTIAVKIHGEDARHQEYIHAMLKRNIPLIFLMRNPMEMFTRHTDIDHTRTIVHYPREEIPQNIAYFFENIKTYELYEGKKQIFYYEDLVDNPAIVIKQLCQFLKVDPSGKAQQKFMDNFDEHFKKSRHVYNTHQGSPSTMLLFLGIDHSRMRDTTSIEMSTIAEWANTLPIAGEHLGMDTGPNRPPITLVFFTASGKLNPGIEALTLPPLDDKMLDYVATRLISKRYDTFCGPSPSAPADALSWYEIANLIKKVDVSAGPGRFLNPSLIIHHGREAIEKHASLAVRIPTDEIYGGTRSDGKTTTRYAIELTTEQRARFWSNFKELCGKDNWHTCERYMNIDYGAPA